MQWRLQSHNSVERADAVTSKPVSMNFEIRQDKIKHTDCFILEQNWNIAHQDQHSYALMFISILLSSKQAWAPYIWTNYILALKHIKNRCCDWSGIHSVVFELDYQTPPSWSLPVSAHIFHVDCWIPVACNPHCSLMIQDVLKPPCCVSLTHVHRFILAGDQLINFWFVKHGISLPELKWIRFWILAN